MSAVLRTLTKSTPLRNVGHMKVLDVADRVIGLQPSYVPHELPALLADIAEAAPALRSTIAWRRLHSLVTG
jgi:hypothetical protein